MSTLALAVAIGLSAHIAWRRDWLAPAAVFCFVATASMAAFYAVAARGWRPATMLTWWQIAGHYEAVAPRVMLFYLGLAGLGYIAWHATAGDDTAAAPPAAHDDGGLASAVGSTPALVAWTLLLALCVWHALAIDWTPLLHSADHLEARRPRGVGLTNPVLATLHRNLPMLGCLLAPLVALAWRGRRPLAATALTGAFAYAAVVSCGIGTRFFILQLALLTVSLHVLHRGRGRGMQAPAALAATATFIAYLVFVATRRGKTYGLVPTLQTLARGDFLTADLPLYVGLSVFGGPFTLAEALLRGDAAYPPAYKLLSFSPLPSAVDGFAAVRDAAQLRVMARAPFGGISETYLFGPAYLLALLLALLVALLVLGTLWRRHRGAAAMLVLAPAYYALAAIHLYPLRNTFRWLTLATLVAAAVLALDAWRRRQPAAVVTFVGTLPPPVTGRTLATRHVVDHLRRRAAVRVLNVSGGARRGVAFRLAKLGRTASALLQLAILPRAENAALYLVANHAHGLWYDAALVALARLRGYRVFLHHQVYSYITRREPRMALVHRLMRRTDTHITLGPRMSSEFQAIYPGERRHLVVSNAVVTLTDPRPQRRPAAAPLRLGHLSNLTVAKGLDTVIATFEAVRKAHPATRLILAGPAAGPREQRLIGQACERMGGAVEHRGPVYGDAKRRFFKEIDVLLLPTRYENEAQPLVIAEALHRGVPVIAFGRGCIPEQVGDAGVAIVPARAFVEDAAATIARWHADPAAWAEVQRCAAAAGERQRREAAAQLQQLLDAMTEPAPLTPVRPAPAAAEAA